MNPELMTEKLQEVLMKALSIAKDKENKLKSMGFAEVLKSL